MKSLVEKMAQEQIEYNIRTNERMMSMGSRMKIYNIECRVKPTQDNIIHFKGQSIHLPHRASTFRFDISELDSFADLDAIINFDEHSSITITYE